MIVDAIHHKIGIDIDLVDRQPVMDESFVALEQQLRIAFECFERMLRHPSVVCVGQMQRAVEMIHRNKRFHAQTSAFFEYFFIKFQAFLVWLFIVAVRENAGPVDRHPEALESHFGAQRQIFFPVMIKIGRYMTRIVRILVDDDFGT